MRRCLVVCALVSVIGIGKTAAWAQTDTPPSPPLADKPRVFITDSNSWQMTASSGGSHGAFGGSAAGGARPQTAEIIKTFGQRCPNVIINNRPDASSYIVELEHEGGKGVFSHKDKVAVFVRQSGDSIFSESTLSVGGSVQDACGAILANWVQYSKICAPLSSPPVTATPASSVSAVDKPKLNIISTPVGADIEINGSFVGNTPSILEVDPGDLEIKISKKGFQTWSRKVKGGTISLSAELDPVTP